MPNKKGGGDLQVSLGAFEGWQSISISERHKQEGDTKK